MTYIPETPITAEFPQDQEQWLGREFEAIQDEFLNAEDGSVGLELSAPATSSTSITLTPIKVAGFDSVLQPQIYGEADTANSVLRLQVPGIWLLTVKLVFTVVPVTSNIARALGMQLYNETKSTAIKTLDYMNIARDQVYAKLGTAIPVRIAQTTLGDNLALYVWAPQGAPIQLTNLDVLNYQFLMLQDYGKTS